MSLHFHELTIKDIRKETGNCISVSFKIPEALEEIYRFSQGQNITIRKTLDGEELRRNYSICTAPSESELRIAIKKLEGGRFSNWANQNLKPGDRLEVLPPTGKFQTPLNPGQKKNYLAFAAGSGITPVISILKTTLYTEPASRFTLIYSNRDRKSIIFLDELENLKNRYMDRLQIVYLLSRELTDSDLLYGRIDREKCSQLCDQLIDPDAFDEFFICGPESMIFSVKNFLESRTVSPDHIHFELFTTPSASSAQQGFSTVDIKKDEKVISSVKVRLDGIVTRFELSGSGETLLNAALRQGIDLPFACKGGVCSTCKARLLEGNVTMDNNYALDADELASGFILTCQSHPVTPSVFVDFDTR